MTNDDFSTGTGATAGARRSPRQGVGGSPIGSTLSIVLAVLAVVVGFLILRNITGDNSASDGGAATDTTVASSSPVTELTTTTTTEPQLVTAGATVVVANASGVPGSAGRMSQELAAIGFTLAEATNATSGLEQSVVYADPANAAAQAVAESVARSMGNLTVEALPATIPVEGGTLGDAAVLVLLGTAQADKTIAEMSPPAAATVAPPPVAGGTPTGTAATTGTTTG
jgi:hypothetical protein